MSKLDWIAVDWGTSRLRAWGIGRDGATLWQADSAMGMGGLKPGDFEAALLGLISDRLPATGVTDVIACGMVGARQGWVEAPYNAVPCKPLASEMAEASVRDNRLRVHVVGGLKQTQPADVMRGEEVQIAGFQALNPQFDGVICLPGSHTKWVQVSAGEVVSFQTYMTGEMFALLAEGSILRHSTAQSGWDDASFADALAEGLARPEKVAARLFSLRAESLLLGPAPETARSRLSGLLIGAELAAARPYWLGQNVAVVGTLPLANRYADALGAQGVPAILADGEAMVLKGLAEARMRLKEQVV